MTIAEKTMGQRIKAQRIRMGMTQEELADILYLKKSSISRYENDKDEMQAARLGELARVCIVHNLNTKSCKAKMENVASPFWRKLQMYYCLGYGIGISSV